MKISYIRAVNKEAASATDAVNDLPVQAFRYGGTAFAAAEIAPLTDMLFADIFGGVYNDAPVKGVVVPTFFFSFEPERITVLSDEGFSCEVEPDAAHKAIRAIGKTCG